MRSPWKSINEGKKQHEEVNLVPDKLVVDRNRYVQDEWKNSSLNWGFPVNGNSNMDVLAGLCEHHPQHCR